MEDNVVTIEDLVVDEILSNERLYQENRIQLEIPDYYDYYKKEEALRKNKSKKEPRRVIEINL
tara:strand:+ start:282 stop:470 length:189 start_codon:yes stop_codon:yes gene_type:complete